MSAGPSAVKVEAFREEPAREHARPLLAPGPFVQALAAPKVEGQGVLSAGWAGLAHPHDAEGAVVRSACTNLELPYAPVQGSRPAVAVTCWPRLLAGVRGRCCATSIHPGVVIISTWAPAAVAVTTVAPLPAPAAVIRYTGWPGPRER